jgi:hypothetical protein
MISRQQECGVADAEPGKLTMIKTRTAMTALARKWSKITRRVMTTITRSTTDDAGTTAAVNDTKMIGIQPVAGRPCPKDAHRDDNGARESEQKADGGTEAKSQSNRYGPIIGKNCSPT